MGIGESVSFFYDPVSVRKVYWFLQEDVKDVVYMQRKEKNYDYDDPLSQLPDDVLIIILSCLTLKEAWRTSVLSSRWMDLWKHTTRLTFESPKALERMRKNYSDVNVVRKERHDFVKCLNMILQLNEAPSLKEFSVHFDLDSSSRVSITKWLEYAFSHHVEKLELVTLTPASTKAFGPYTFPKELLCHSNVKPLKILNLKGVIVYDKDLEFFIDNSQFLEQMVIWHANRLSKLEFSGLSIKLKILELHHCIMLKSVKVCDTNLASFSIEGNSHPTLMLESLPSLTNVSLGICNPCISIRNVSSLLPSSTTQQLETLKLVIRDPTNIMPLPKFPDLTKLKKLVLCFDGSYNSEYLIRLVHLLSVAPFLQEFILELNWHGFNPAAVRSVPSVTGEELKMTETYPPQFLKVFKISGFAGQYNEFVVLMYFVKYAVSLETLKRSTSVHSVGYSLNSTRFFEVIESIVELLHFLYWDCGLFSSCKCQDHRG